MKDMKERMVFLEQHGADPTLASAVLSAPAFLSDLTERELTFVRFKLEQRALPPGVVEAKVAVAKALREVEAGWERAKARIASGGGLEKAREARSASRPRLSSRRKTCEGSSLGVSHRLGGARLTPPRFHVLAPHWPPASGATYRQRAPALEVFPYGQAVLNYWF